MAGVIVPGQEVECLCVAIELAKDRVILPNGKVYDRVGFKIGGGMDQDPNESPFRYPDTGIYITAVEPDSPAEKAGLKKHDKILQVNEVDFTMVTHERAVKCIKRASKLTLMIARREISI